jgi:phage tail sheath gpL-like
MISNAVGSERVSRVVGYEVQKGANNEALGNLPQRIAVFGQINTDKQADFTADPDPVEVTSEQQAGQLFGFGSQIHQIMRILRSRFGDTTGGIPTVVYPQLAPAGAAAEVQTITVGGGPATGAGVIAVKINGRETLDGGTYRVSVSADDTAADVAQKISDAINNVLSCPVSAGVAADVVTLTTKWQGEAAGGLQVEVVSDDLVGMTYAVAQSQAAAGDSTPEITASLQKFGEEWNTIVINPYDRATTNPIFEQFNGVPGTQSGRYLGIVFKPFVCLSGDLTADTVANVTALNDKDQGTIVNCPAPNSKGWAFEAAANCAALLARQAQDSPHLDIQQKSYPDMPTPVNGDAGIFSEYNDRDAIVKAGGSTVTIRNQRYVIEDFVTTYHPDGEIPPSFRYVRSLIQDWNIRYRYFLLEMINVIDKAIVPSDQATQVQGIVKPKQWIQILNTLADNLALDGIIAEPSFMKDSIQVAGSDTNPDRFETFFKYKRSSFARIASTTAEANFAFGIE